MDRSSFTKSCFVDISRANNSEVGGFASTNPRGNLNTQATSPHVRKIQPTFGGGMSTIPPCERGFNDATTHLQETWENANSFSMTKAWKNEWEVSNAAAATHHWRGPSHQTRKFPAEEVKKSTSSLGHYPSWRDGKVEGPIKRSLSSIAHEPGSGERDFTMTRSWGNRDERNSQVKHNGWAIPVRGKASGLSKGGSKSPLLASTIIAERKAKQAMAARFMSMMHPLDTDMTMDEGTQFHRQSGRWVGHP